MDVTFTTTPTKSRTLPKSRSTDASSSSPPPPPPPPHRQAQEDARATLPNGMIRSKTSPISRENRIKRSRTMPYSAVTSVISSDCSADTSPHNMKARRRRSVREITRAFSISFLSVVSPSHDTLTNIGVNEEEKSPQHLLPTNSPLRDRYPMMNYVAYNMDMPNSAVHALILVHTAANRELCDLLTHILPLCERAKNLHSITDQNKAMSAISTWWSDFVKLSDLVAHCQTTCIERLYVRFVDEEIAYVGRSETQAIERARERITERTGVSRELVMKAVSDCIKICDGDGDSGPNEKTFRHISQAANMAVSYLLETYQLSSTFVTIAEKSFRRSKVTGLVVFMLRKLKEYDSRERALLTTMLVRGMEHDTARNWVYKYLGFRAFRKFNEWRNVHALERNSVLDTIIHLSATAAVVESD